MGKQLIPWPLCFSIRLFQSNTIQPHMWVARAHQVLRCCDASSLGSSSRLQNGKGLAVTQVLCSPEVSSGWHFPGHPVISCFFSSLVCLLLPLKNHVANHACFSLPVLNFHPFPPWGRTLKGISDERHTLGSPMSNSVASRMKIVS